MQDFIEVIGAKQHNLKNINVKIPKNQLVVFTGVSGSGKSSLAFDTIFAEGQRRYIESLSLTTLYVHFYPLAGSFTAISVLYIPYSSGSPMGVDTSDGSA